MNFRHMNSNLISARSIRRVFAAVFCLLAGSATVFGSTFILEGQSKGDTNWITSNLRNWQELDYIPCRVRISGGAVTNQTITITFPHLTGTTPGFENLISFTTSPNVTITSGPTLSAPAGADWSYTFTVNYTDAGDGYVQFLARLAAGAHLNVGSSLMIGGSPQSMGQLQVHKPAAGPGRRDDASARSARAPTAACAASTTSRWQASDDLPRTNQGSVLIILSNRVDRTELYGRVVLISSNALEYHIYRPK